MKKKSLVLLLAFAMIFTFALSACGGSSSEESAEETTGTADVAAAYNKILDGLNSEAADTDEEIVVAMSPDFAPMEFVDTSRSGEEQYVGYDVLLAKYIANHPGKKLVISNENVTVTTGGAVKEPNGLGVITVNVGADGVFTVTNTSAERNAIEIKIS